MPCKSELSTTQYFIVRISAFIIIKNEVSDEYYLDFVNRNIKWINSFLIPNNFNYRYEFRIIYNNNHSPKSDAIDFYIIVAADRISKTYFDTYCSNFLVLLENTFPEYEFNDINPKEYNSVLNPFEINHITEITRRTEEVKLDTFYDRLNKPIGFEQNRIHKNKATSNSIIHISPFTKGKDYLNTYIKHLIKIGQPYLVSITLSNCEPKIELIEFVTKQIVYAEKLVQTNIFSGTDLDYLYPAFKDRARYYKSYQERLYSTLANRPLLMQIRVASSLSISTVNTNILANYITSSSLSNYLLKNNSDVHACNYMLSDIPLSEIKEQKNKLTKISFMTTGNSLLKNEYSSLNYIYDSNEAACAFSLPLLYPESLEPLNIIQSPKYPINLQVPYNGVEIGVNKIGRYSKTIRINPDDRRRHMYIVGQTGTGKTTLIKNMILSDINNNEGLCVLDPHGDLYKDILNSIPESRIKDVVLIDPTDIDFPVGINMLEFKDESQRFFAVEEMIHILKKLMQDEYNTNAVSQFAGPIFFQHVKMNLLLVMSNPAKPGTLFDFYNIFQKKDHWLKWLPLKISDPLLQDWVTTVLPFTDYVKASGEGISLGSYISSKFESFLFDPMLRNIFSSPVSTIDFNEIMNTKKILLVNLAKGELSEQNSRFLGLIIMAKIQAAALERAKVQKKMRNDFYVYVDEFQSITTENFATLLSEGRKFRINLILANQFISQVTPTIINAIFGNVGTLFSFRIGVEDSAYFEKKFFPYIIKSHMTNLPNHHAYCSTLVEGKATIPFSIETLLPKINNDRDSASMVINSSREQYSVRNRK